MSDRFASNDAARRWPMRNRAIVFALAASSIACLLADFYGLCPMNVFTPFIFLPLFVALCSLAMFDRVRGDGHVWRAVWIGMLGGHVVHVVSERLQHSADGTVRDCDRGGARRFWCVPRAVRALVLSAPA